MNPTLSYSNRFPIIYRQDELKTTEIPYFLRPEEKNKYISGIAS